MFNIYLNVDGERRPLEDIEDVLMEAVAKAIAEGYENALEPLRPEIDACGGSVSVDVSTDLKSATVTTDGLSPDLDTRVVDLLRDIQFVEK